MKLKKLFKIYFEEPGEPSGGEGPETTTLLDDPTNPDPTAPEGGQSQAGGTETAGGDVGGEGTVTSTAAPTTFDTKAFAEQFADSLVKAGVVNKPASPEAKPMTPEEARVILERDFKVKQWEPTKEWLTKYNNLDTQGEALREMVHANNQYIDAISQLRGQVQQNQLLQQFQPIMARVEAQQAVERQTRFNTSYPQLSKPELNPLMGAVIKDLGQRGEFSGLDEPSIFKKIAESVGAVIAASNPEFKLTPAGSTPAGKPTKPANALKPTTSGARGGGKPTGGGAAGGKTMSKAMALLSGGGE